jgi:hypothetical protein
MYSWGGWFTGFDDTLPSGNGQIILAPPHTGIDSAIFSCVGSFLMTVFVAEKMTDFLMENTTK